MELRIFVNNNTKKYIATYGTLPLDTALQKMRERFGDDFVGSEKDWEARLVELL